MRCGDNGPLVVLRKEKLRLTKKKEQQTGVQRGWWSGKRRASKRNTDRVALSVCTFWEFCACIASLCLAVPFLFLSKRLVLCAHAVIVCSLVSE